MYNDKLEKLIDAALADGIVTDKEKQILYKNAEAMGVDLDEFEMVLEARIFEKQQSQQNASSPTSRSKKYGDVRKCPACGAIIQSFQTQCSDCGHEITNVSANNSVKIISDKLEQVIIDCDEMDFTDKSLLGGLYGMNIAEQIESRKRNEIKKRQRDVITNFPIPNTREDILEMLHFMGPKVKTGFKSDDNIEAWRNKFKEVISRAEFAFSKDQKMMSEIEKFKKEYKSTSIMTFISWFSQLSKQTKVMVIFSVVFVVLMTVLLMSLSVGESSHAENVAKEKTRLENKLQECKNAIADKDYVQAKILANELVWEYSDNWSRVDTDELKETWVEKRNNIIETINEQKNKKR